MSFKGKVLHALVHSVGRLSTGIELSLTHGMISGTVLEYIYRNQPSGRFGIGKLIDRLFLSNIGWQAIRLRKRNLVDCLAQAIRLQSAAGEPVLMVDVASGPARYILDVLAQFPDEEISVICRDLDERGLQQGRENAAALGLTRVTFEQGDALDAAGFAALPAAPQIMVSSGFYDWINDDAVVQRSIEIVHQVLAPGGLFVFTNQSGHFDLEATNEAFNDWNHEPLRMKTRPAALMNDWLTAAGFTLVEARADQWGYYTVSIAKKEHGVSG